MCKGFGTLLGPRWRHRAWMGNPVHSVHGVAATTIAGSLWWKTSVVSIDLEVPSALPLGLPPSAWESTLHRGRFHRSVVPSPP